MSSLGPSKSKRRNAAGNRFDIGWQYGVNVDKNAKKVQCKFCEKIFNEGIFCLKHYLACIQKDVEPRISVPDDVKKQVISILVKNSELLEKKRKLIYDINGDLEDDSIEVEQA
ncbi:hypothetical protein P3X46_034148, partial [Hevea brasiliensis]